MSGRLEGKIALVTGSTSGIGRGIAVEFARQGAKVVVTGRRASLGQEVVDEIVAAGGEAAFCAADLSQKEDVIALAKFVGDTYGGLDILVNNAAPAKEARDVADGGSGHIGDTSEEWWDQMYAVGLRGYCLCSKYLMPYLIKSGHGSIVNVSSIHGLRGTGWDAYSMIKGAVIALTRSMAVGYAKDKVRVNCVCPGIVLVERNAPVFQEDPSKLERILKNHLTRAGTPQDLAYAAVYLGSEESEYVTGAIMAIDGGANAFWPSH